MRGTFIAFVVTILVSSFFGSGCSLVATRPVQLMSDTSAAIRAAKEVQADTLSPELFRRANEWFLKAKREYRFKNFHLTQEYAEKAKRFAEQAEFESLRSGGNRVSERGGVEESKTTSPSEPPASENSTPETAWPKPKETPVDEYEERKAAEDEAKKKASAPQPSPSTPPDSGENTPNFFNPQNVRRK